MNSFRTLISSLALAALLVGCGPDDNGGGDAECTSNLVTGDLVITEIMANPFGEDEGKEWFEIYNGTTGTLDLVGLQLFAAKEDGSSESVHFMTEAIVDAGDYFVVGGVLNEFKPAYVDYGYASDLSALNNTAGKIGLRCGMTLVDEVIYGTMDNGEAQGLDGNSTPDHTANDNLTNWCAGTSSFETDQFGTPGAANDACSIVAPTTCNDGGTDRAVVSPVAGDVIITEIMPNPDIVSDNAGEWFEVLVLKDVDVNGLNYGKVAGTPEGAISSPDCIRVTAGTHLVIARSDVTADNGMLPRVDGTFTFSLTNSSGTLFVGVGDTTLDIMTYTGSGTGAAKGLDPTKNTPTDNDTEAFWCNEPTITYGAGDKGTPGAANSSCDIPPPDGMCMDGGNLRPVVKPVAADITITEVMPDPMASGDTMGEYFEIRVDATVDLNGLQFGKTSPPTSVFNPTACERVTAGTYVVFARSDVMATNGMIPTVTGTFSFGLTNGGDSLFVGMDDTVFDMTTWTSSNPGNSHALNESTMVWCVTSDTEVFGAGDHGTPNAINTTANLTCP